MGTNFMNEKKTKIISSERLLQLCVIALLGCMTFLIMMYSKQSPWRKAESWTDSSVFKYVALVMSKGGMPYADAFDHKGPVLYLLNLLGMQFGYMRGIWLVEFVWMFGTLAAMYKTARLFCGRVTSCIAVLISSRWIFDYFQYGNFTEEYAMFPISVATFIFLDYMLNDKVNRFRVMICGLSFATVFLLRANMIGLWIAFCVAVFIKLVVTKEFKKLWEFILYFVIGMGILMVPICIWLAVNGAFEEFIQAYFVFNLTYSTELGGRALTKAKWNSFMHFFNQEIVLWAVMILLYLCVKGKKKLVAVTYLSYVFLMFLLMCMSGMQYGHYGMTLVPALIYPVSYLLGEVEDTYKKKGNPLILALVMYFLAALVMPTWLNACNNAVQVRENQENSSYTAVVRKLLTMIDEFTEEDEPISVYGNWNIVYVLSKRTSASVYSYQFPIGTIDTTIMDRYFEEIRANNPKMMIIQEGRMTEQMKLFLEEYDYGLYWNEKKDNSGCQVYIKGLADMQE